MPKNTGISSTCKAFINWMLRTPAAEERSSGHTVLMYKTLGIFRAALNEPISIPLLLEREEHKNKFKI